MKILGILLLLCWLPVAGFAQSNLGQMDLYILMGQSNMAGRGLVTQQMQGEHHDSVYVLNQALQWVAARHPLHFDKPAVAAAGPGLMFGITMALHSPGGRIGLIPCAVGGSLIEHWLPGAYDAGTDTHPYDDAVKRIKAAMPYGTIKGVIWHQGESNSSPAKARIYLQQLKELIVRVRQLVNNPGLPFIAGELGRFYKNQNNINSQLRLLPQQVTHTAVVSSEQLLHKGDSTHFDGPSADELGRRYAIEMLRITHAPLPAKLQK